MFQRSRRPYSAVLLLLLSVAERVLLGYTISPNGDQGTVAEQVQFDQSTFGPTLSFKEYREFSTARIKSSWETLRTAIFAANFAKMAGVKDDCRLA